MSNSIAKNQSNRAMLLMFTCAALWSTAGIFIKLIPWNPIIIAGMRSGIASIVFIIYMKVKKIKFTLNKQSIMAAVFVSLTFFAFVTANKLTTAANAIVLQFTCPVFILAFSALIFKQKFIKVDYVVVALTLFGISLFFLDSLAPGNLLGNIIAVLAGASMSMMFIITGRSDEPTRMTGLLSGHLLTAIIGIPLMFFVDTPMVSSAFISIFLLGIVQLGIPYLLYGIAAKNCPALACSLISAVEPLLNPVWVFIFDGEAPGILALIGGVIVVAGITWWCIYKDKMAKATA